jgi:hypothetical protein
MKQPSLGGMADAMKAMLSRQALHQRFTQAAVAFMQGCLERMLRRLSVEAVVCTPLLQLFKRVLMLDSSSWDVAPALRHLLPGSGGSASAANCKVQVCLDYLTGLICFVQSTAGTRPDNTSVDPVLEMLQPQDLLLFDLGYFRLKTFRRIVDMGAFFLSRLCAQVTLCDAGTGTPIDLCTWLRTTCANTCCRQVMLGPAAGTQVTCRLICLRVAAHIAEQRRRTMKRNAVKKGHTCSQRHLMLAEWTLLITNVPESWWPVEALWSLYSLRWQIELLFKRLKSTLAIDHTNTANVHRLHCQLYGTLILAALMQHLYATLNNDLWNARKEQLSPDKLFKRLQERASMLAQLLIASQAAGLRYLRQSIHDILPNCIKRRQPSRRSSLETIHIVGATMDRAQPALT